MQRTQGKWEDLDMEEKENCKVSARPGTARADATGRILVGIHGGTGVGTLCEATGALK